MNILRPISRDNNGREKAIFEVGEIVDLYIYPKRHETVNKVIQICRIICFELWFTLFSIKYLFKLFMCPSE